MRILVGYICAPGPVDARIQYEGWIDRLRNGGFEVDGFCLTLNPPAWNLSWAEVDWRWRTGDKELLELYEQLAKNCERYDVFLNYSGVSVHPDFVRQLPTFNVFSCFDDPESSDELSKPAAGAYDLVLVGNIAEVETYRSWGIKNPRWWPLGFRATDYDSKLQASDILNGTREVDLTLLCERNTVYRRARLNRIARSFPRGRYHGRGWPAGFLPEKERIPLLQQTKIGINIHHSTGPINFRTFYLPANGVLQLCDNKSYLGKIYKLDQEVVGFDSINEAIELCRYYLAKDDERRAIAARGWQRAVRDYNEISCFSRLTAAVQEMVDAGYKLTSDRRGVDYLHIHSDATRSGRVRTLIRRLLFRAAILMKKVRRKLVSWSIILCPRV